MTKVSTGGDTGRISASQWAINDVLAASERSTEGRSQFFWTTDKNGDVMLACFPQGATYENIEFDLI